METTAHLCGSTFFNFQPQRLPAPSGPFVGIPPAGTELPPLNSSKVYKLVLVFGDCDHGSVVTASPTTGIEVNREVVAHDGTITAIAVTPLQPTTIRAWRNGTLVGAAVLTAAGSLNPAG